MPGRRVLQIAGYVAVVAGCFALGMVAGWNRFAVRVENQAYDLLSEPDQGPPAQEAVIIAIDEATLRARGERQNLRKILVEALDKLRDAQPKAVAVDVILAGEAADPTDDARLEAALRSTRNLILDCLVDSNGAWETPLPRFGDLATAIGHVHYEADRSDGVSRQLDLEKIYAGERRWAMALEAFRVAHDAEIIGSPEDVEVGKIRIPAALQYLDESSRNATRPFYIRYLPVDAIPTISVLDIDAHKDQIRGKTAFVGVTALSLANDRIKIPSGETVAGVAVHAHAYETIRRGSFLTNASNTAIFSICAALAIAVGLAFGFLPGWPAYAIVFPLLAFALYLPSLFYRYDVIFPIVAPTAVAWLCAAGAATYRYFVLQGTLRKTESDKARYQQAIHWAAHEMRTPLTAIQGSSELMSRYANKLPEEKRGQLSEMINSESKRLARIIQTFLDVERLAEGQMELKREPFSIADVVHICLARVAPLAERKQIEITLEDSPEATVNGDRELMEYALYNLLTNAVKYSPAETHIHVRGNRTGRDVQISVQDQGIGMDAKELKNIFKKFYRTKKAEASGEVGTGIGLSIVEQIVTHHGGRIEVTSTPGKGSCFTMVVPAQ